MSARIGFTASDTERQTADTAAIFMSRAMQMLAERLALEKSLERDPAAFAIQFAPLLSALIEAQACQRAKVRAVITPPAIEIRLILSAPGMGWEYVARKHGEAIAASDGDAHFPQLGAALFACVDEIKAELPQQGGDDGR